jgi:hypothetical protein
VSEQLPDRPTEEHPIAAGLAALVGVTVAVGLILGLLVLGGSRVLGLGGDDDSTATSAERSMYLPKPEKTPTATNPEFTFDPSDGESPSASSGAGKPTRSESPRQQITLAAAATTAGPMEPFDLTGVYPGGEGAILQVQRFQDGSWQDFNATTSVSDETFQTPIQTSQPGVNRFRVVDTDTQLESNEVRITIG